MSINAIETLQFNCTTCPSECLLTVEVERDADGAVAEVRSVTGNSCLRGDTFAHQELTCPMRVLTTTVAVSGGDEQSQYDFGAERKHAPRQECGDEEIYVAPLTQCGQKFHI